jgi:hypothetical protein
MSKIDNLLLYQAINAIKTQLNRPYIDLRLEINPLEDGIMEFNGENIFIKSKLILTKTNTGNLYIFDSINLSSYELLRFMYSTRFPLIIDNKHPLVKKLDSKSLKTKDMLSQIPKDANKNLSVVKITSETVLFYFI